jgi:hypothetical protein
MIALGAHRSYLSAPQWAAAGVDVVRRLCILRTLLKPLLNFKDRIEVLLNFKYPVGIPLPGGQRGAQQPAAGGGHCRGRRGGGAAAVAQ